MRAETLENHTKKLKEIQAMRSEINTMYDTRKSLFSAGGSNHSRNLSDPVVKAMHNIDRKEELLRKAIEDYAQECLEIEKWLQTIPDPTLCAIVRYRFLLCRSWTQISNAVYGYPDPDVCRQYYKRHKKEIYE